MAFTEPVLPSSLSLTVTLSLLDDDNYLGNSSQDVGEIKVVVHKVKVTSSKVELPRSSQSYSGSLQPAKIHEQSKKGYVHQIR